MAERERFLATILFTDIVGSTTALYLRLLFGYTQGLAISLS
jgi:hypothetical protein